MQTYLVFLQNLKTGEEFVAPATADSHDGAMLAVGDKYPPRMYKLQTCYTLEAIERIVADTRRWPGVASSVQPTLEQLTKRVVVGGNLPPLFREKPAFQPSPEPAASQASALEVLKALRQPVEAQMQMRRETQTVAPTPAPAAQPKAPPAKPAMRTMAATIMKKPAAQPSVSVLDVLKNLRG